MAAVVVFGSLNHDLAVTLPRLPRPDETLRAHGLASFAGGKGANQAVAAARLGATVAMVGAVGDDDAGRMLREVLRRNGVDDRFVATVPGPSGTALPLVADDGDVAILIVAGANGAVGPADADRAAEAIAAADVLLLQGEVSAAASARAAAIARDNGTLVVFNPAPVPDGADAVIELADVVIVNRREAEQLGLGPLAGRSIVTTCGPEGALVDGVAVAPFPVGRVLDPTGAGDAFAGALAVHLAEGLPLHAAARAGNAAGALAVGVAGAEPSFPTRLALEARLAG
jgi:ribokinase